MANLLAASAARNIPVKVVIGFVDATANELLALDSNREAPLSMVALGNASPAAVSLSPQVEPMKFETVPLSKQEIDYPAMRAMHEASSLEARRKLWRGTRQRNRKPPRRKMTEKKKHGSSFR